MNATRKCENRRTSENALFFFLLLPLVSYLDPINVYANTLHSQVNRPDANRPNLQSQKTLRTGQPKWFLGPLEPPQDHMDSKFHIASLPISDETRNTRCAKTRASNVEQMSKEGSHE